MNKLCENTDDMRKQISFVSHEIRNNISICDMYSQIIKRRLENVGVNDTSIVNAIDCIQKSMHLISANLTDLKAIGESELLVCHLDKMLRNAVELSKAYIADKFVEYSLDICSDANIYTDENKFLSCIVNILKNAIEAMNTDGKISVSSELQGEFAVIRISNNGSAIPESVQNAIFDYGYTTKQTGSGFGLCLCKQYLEKLNASLKLTKSDEKETVFEIVVPVAS